jgi:hypothetical protein
VRSTSTSFFVYLTKNLWPFFEVPEFALCEKVYIFAGSFSRDMKRSATHKCLIIWLLLIIFVLPFGIKTFHVHHFSDYDFGVTANGRGHHHCDDCPICHFTLSTFIQPKFTAFQPILSCCSVVSAVYPEDISFRIILSPHLRGPPAI